MVNILMTGGRSPASLELLRHLSYGGARVYVAESDPHNMSGASRFCQDNFAVPSPRQHTQAFVDRLIEIIKQASIDLLIPTCEETYYISKWKPLLEKHCAVFTDSIDVLTNLHSKYQFVQLLQALKIPYPTSVRVTSQEQLMNLLPDWNQYVLKPEFSRFSSHVIINAPPQEVFKAVFPSEQAPWVLQEYLPGSQFCSYGVAQQGNLLAHSIYPSVYCAGRGATVYFENIHYPEIEDQVRLLVKSLNYTGQISLDLIQTHRGFVPIECNPRTTNGTYLFDFKDQLIQAFSAYNCPTLYPTRQEPRMVSMAMLGYVLPKVAFKPHFWPFLKAFFKAKDTMWRLDDLTPFFSQFASVWLYSRWARQHKVSLLEAATMDIEWNGHWPEGERL